MSTDRVSLGPGSLESGQDQTSHTVNVDEYYYPSIEVDGLDREYWVLSPQYWKREDLPPTILIESRRSDLERHMRTQHNAKPVYFDCPKKRCARKGAQGFTRLDHLNKHLRNYHMDTINLKSPLPSPSAPPELDVGGSQEKPDGDLNGELSAMEVPVNPPAYPKWPSSGSHISRRNEADQGKVDPVSIRYAKYTNKLLISHGIKPKELAKTHFNSFQQQPPELQWRTIEMYAQNRNQHRQAALQKNNPANDKHSGGSLGEYLSDFYVRPARSDALSDYHMQLALLEEQNKMRLRVERDRVTHSGDRPTDHQMRPTLPGKKGEKRLRVARGERAILSCSAPRPEEGQLLPRGPISESMATLDGELTEQLGRAVSPQEILGSKKRKAGYGVLEEDQR
ncbi:hypothetical protein FGG08_002558 [Glutinoglossum americanum]|uniref:C2H2-type domain-containing protein n=1 Tax=Glutinoglossum americanum TaxID=1670608 RepID=A0A9P8L1K5_9PEZI|nr:hypothetical protein FGG08_002558 [Glutinoglossum americanum]